MENLREAVNLGKRLGRVLIATADRAGSPHITVAGKISLDPSGHLIVEEWFCPGALANLRANPGIALVVWDEKRDAGYQLLGRTVHIRDREMMNGYVPGEEQKAPIPQVERQLVIHVEHVMAFSKGPHSDSEE